MGSRMKIRRNVRMSKCQVKIEGREKYDMVISDVLQVIFTNNELNSRDYELSYTANHDF